MPLLPPYPNGVCPESLYVDNGSAFRSRQLEYTTAALGIALIHAKPYQPQGKGKIERFFKTVRTQFLPAFSGTTLEQINSAFDVWLGEYHSREHSATKQSPFRRFTSKMECLRTAPDNRNQRRRGNIRKARRGNIFQRSLQKSKVQVIFVTGATAAGTGPVNLGTAGNFMILIKTRKV